MECWKLLEREEMQGRLSDFQKDCLRPAKWLSGSGYFFLCKPENHLPKVIL